MKNKTQFLATHENSNDWQQKDLNLFYKAISEGRGDLINGSRLIYKPYAGAMRTLNYFGNIFLTINFR